MSRRKQRTPDPDEQVRRWLAEARHTDPMPSEVAERMDRVIAGLADDPSRRATVVRLADRRRRAATMLVAAAAVVVAGVGVGQIVGGGDGDQAETALDAQTTDEAPAAEAEAAPGPTAGGGRELTEDTTTRRQLTRVRPRWFAEDAAALRDRVVASSQSGAERDQAYAADGRLRATRQAVCEPGTWGRGRYRPVSYGGAAGYLVFRRPRGDTQVVDLFLCGSEVVVRSVTLPR